MANFEPIQINLESKKRDSSWVQVCPNCQNERIVSYAQSWNLLNGNSKKECRSCQQELGLLVYNIEGLKLGRKKHKLKPETVFSNKTLYYKNIFNHNTNNSTVIEKMRNAKLGKRGKETNRYIDGRSKENNLIRSRDQYKQFRFSVFQRDKFKCQDCSQLGGKLEMHHIKEWCNYPELRFVESNCITLCKICHSKTNNYKTKALKLVSNG